MSEYIKEFNQIMDGTNKFVSENALQCLEVRMAKSFFV